MADRPPVTDRAALTYAIADLLDEYHDKLAEYADAQLELEIIAGKKPAEIDISDVVTKAINWYHADLTTYHVGQEADAFLAEIESE